MNEYVEVETKAGKVRGKWRDTTGEGNRKKSAAFLGIPFAEPPVGDLRFEAPKPKAPWEGVRDALEYGATAQRGDPGVTLIPEPSIPGESTLNVNVFTPSPEPAKEGEGLPVLAYIHGGGYFAGSPASPWYDGRNFNRDDVVTVTLSYRLGFDGFGWINGTVQNRGVRDWLLGLKWIQDNVAQFGGDPSRVTIAGQSAGAGSVLTLLGMEDAQDLFHQVFAISAPTPDVSMEASQKFAAELAKELGVPNNLAGFRSVPEDRLLTGQKELTDMSPKAMKAILKDGLPLAPTVDGNIIKRRTMDSLKQGVGADKHLLIGATDDEMSMAMLEMKDKFKWVPSGLLLAMMGVPLKAIKPYLEANRSLLEKGKHALAGQAMSDQMIRLPSFKAAEARGDAPTWLYRFSWASPQFDGAVHCVDVPYIFDCLDGPAVEALEGPNPPQELADLVHQSTVEFIREGDPGWPPYTPADHVVRVWDLPPSEMVDAYASLYPLYEAE